MTNIKLLTALNAQVTLEFASSYLYLSMSADLAGKGLPGFAHWMHIQAKEEVTHAMKLYNYILTRGGKVTLKGIDAPQSVWKAPIDVFKAALAHEHFITAQINKIMDIALKDRDHATSSFLQWYVNEQVQEEQSFSDILVKLQYIGKDGSALLQVDKELQSRIFVDETAVASAV